ncbi:MAG TPA: tyrosine--tRNA ligase, partial [Candidatus Marinimicrobia bacterium]|nr:tyrosine--tRNA ligase [Candidatus Neomarinimicrobiota bacterium]
MKNFPPLNEQMDFIRKGAEEIIPEEELVKKIERSIITGNPLRIKLGADPSRPDLHIGHAVVLGKLRDFQLLGHQAVLIIGDFTAMIGDPTGRNKTRPSLTLEETKANARSYFDQAGVILDKDRLEIRYNSEWLNPMSFQDIIALAARYTVARMLERDDFAKRLKNGIPVSIHELLYPLAQAYDSVAIQSDLELGGTDQKFNLLVGRDIQKEYGMEAQVTLTMPLLVGLDGKEKMSKSLGNYIGITDAPNEIYGKTLSIPDELILRYFTLTTDLRPDQIRRIEDEMSQGKNPRDAKHQLAWELTRTYHSIDAANAARNEFEKVFVERGIPEDIEAYQLMINPVLVANLISESGLAPSNAEAKRLIKQGGVSINGNKINDFMAEYQFMDGDII